MNGRRRFNGLVAVVVGVASLVALAAVGAWSAGTFDRTAPRPEGAASGASPVGQASAAPSFDVEVLRRERVAGDTPPEFALGLSALRAKADPAEARRAFASQGTVVYVLPAADGRACLASMDHAVGGCFPVPAAGGEPSAAAVICSPFKPADELLVYGLVADGTTELSLEFADGSTRAVPTGQNVFLVSAPRHDPLPTRLRWTDAATGAERSVSAGVPGDAGDEACDTSRTPEQAEAELARAWAQDGGRLRRQLAEPPREDPAQR
jgi:hypothetical protein